MKKTPPGVPPTGKGRWDLLAQKVRAFQPSVVVLIARKAPRIAQALELDFGPSALVISDLAIPFCRAELKGARVAIVDDIVNVGSTLLRAREAVVDAGAAQAHAFAIADKGSEARLEGLADLTLADPVVLDDLTRDVLTAEIPDRLQRLGLPYDLDFPVLACRVPRAESSFDYLRDALVERYGGGQLYDLTTPAGAEADVQRMTVDLSEPFSVPTKVRIYLNGHTQRCALAPIKLPTPIATQPPENKWASRYWHALGANEIDEEARGRLRLFLDSLVVGLSFVSRNSDLFSCDIEAPFVASQTELIFGPRAKSAARTLAGWPSVSWVVDNDKEVETAGSKGRASCSPFLAAARETGLIDAIGDRIEGDADELSVFIAFFNILAEWVGADDPSKFRLEKPVSPSEVEAVPYRRLRIGPTFVDLATIIDEFVPRLSSREAWMIVSRLLDRFVDDGGVVPTTAAYGDHLYRIYRKGERDPRDRASLRTRRAWDASKKALSLTRASKLLTILAFSEDTAATDVQVKTVERGNVFCHAGTVLHDEAEIAHRLRRTGQLEEARDAK